MKIRTDFVTNSSSSSFIIAKKYLDLDQIEAIRKHSKLGKKLGLEYADDEWEIVENASYIKGFTSLDNFNMDEFLNLIGVPHCAIDWSGWDSPDLPEEDSWGSTHWREMLLYL